MSIQKSWTLVPKPRSAIKTVEWFPSMLKIEGALWNKKDEQGEHPIRREYIKDAHPFDEYISDDPEVNARMEFARYQTLGLAYLEDGNNAEEASVVITKAGKELSSTQNKDEIILRQLLKWQFPSNIHSGSKYEGMKIFPLEIVIKVLEKYKEVNRLEVAFSFFTCTNISEIDKVYYKIDEFRKLVAGKPANQHRKIFLENFSKFNGEGNQPETYLGSYDDTLFRYLEYTSMFETSGRSEFTRIFVPERAKIKFKQLAENYSFVFREDFDNKTEFYKYFGDPYSNVLPWDKPELLSEVVNSKFEILGNKEYLPLLKEASKSLNMHKLKNLEDKIDTEILNKNEKEFIELKSKTKEERESIIQKFVDINEDNEELSALWLEVNTWKSLVAMNGKHFVKRNFKIEVDLTPRSFASGTNNTPDMEFYNQKYILIPEVTMQSGVQQWITEGSSIVEHVSKFLDIKNGKKFLGYENIEKYINPDNIKAIYGFFLCQKINPRMLWQLYILNRETWLGEPVAVVPMEISNYIEILKLMYEKDTPAIHFEELVENLALSAKKSDNYTSWRSMQEQILSEFYSKISSI